MPGICRYPVKGTGQTVNQGGTADSERLFVLDKERIFARDFFMSLTKCFRIMKGVSL